MAPRPFEEIVAEHGPAVMRVCRALVGPSDAEDAWSETFLSALQAYPRLRQGSNVRGWLVTIAHRKAIDLVRRTARRPSLQGDLPESAAAAGIGGSRGATDPDLHFHGDLRAALDALPPKQRGAVIYRYLAELSYAEVGALLDCSPAAARRNASDGIAQLRKLFFQEKTT